LAELTVAWDPNLEPDVAGYRLYYGVASRAYSQTLDVGASTSATVAGLEKGKTYYFAVTAYSTQGQESERSDEVIYQLPSNEPPTVEIPSPGQFNRGGVIRIDAAATDADGVISKVEFYAGEKKIGEAKAAPFEAIWNEDSIGEHTVRAIAYDDSGASSSAEVKVEVKELAIRQIDRLTDRSLQVKVTGAIGHTNRIYASSDLVQWTLIATATNTDGVVTVIDPEAAGESRRFYKAEAD
jgi:hypothetical protein